MFRKIFFFKFVPEYTDLALFAMRVMIAVSILLKHGIEKVFNFQYMLTRLTGNHHYVAAIGVTPSLICAAIADGILTVLLALGIATRWCAALCFINLAVAWSAVLNFPYFTPAGSDRRTIIGGTQGEMIIVYMAVLLAFVLAGGGKFSIDTLLERE